MAQILVELSKIKANISIDLPPPTDSSTPATSKHHAYEKQKLPSYSGPEFQKLWQEEVEQVGVGHKTVLMSSCPEFRDMPAGSKVR